MTLLFPTSTQRSNLERPCWQVCDVKHKKLPISFVLPRPVVVAHALQIFSIHLSMTFDVQVCGDF
jgi:hypothetical protein